MVYYSSWISSPKCMKPAQLLVGVLFHDFSRKRYFSCKNGTQSRKWKGKIKKSVLHPVPQMAARHGGAHCSAFRHWKCPQLGQGRENIMFSPLPKLWALPMSESGAMGAAVFFQCDSRPLFDTFCLENLSVFSIHQKMEQNPTYNWADLIHFRDEC